MSKDNIKIHIGGNEGFLEKTVSVKTLLIISGIILLIAAVFFIGKGTGENTAGGNTTTAEDTQAAEKDDAKATATEYQGSDYFCEDGKSVSTASECPENKNVVEQKTEETKQSTNTTQKKLTAADVLAAQTDVKVTEYKNVVLELTGYVCVWKDEEAYADMKSIKVKAINNEKGKVYPHRFELAMEGEEKLPWIKSDTPGILTFLNAGETGEGDVDAKWMSFKEDSEKKIMAKMFDNADTLIAETSKVFVLSKDKCLAESD